MGQGNKFLKNDQVGTNIFKRLGFQSVANVGAPFANNGPTPHFKMLVISLQLCFVNYTKLYKINNNFIITLQGCDIPQSKKIVDFTGQSKGHQEEFFAVQERHL